MKKIQLLPFLLLLVLFACNKYRKEGKVRTNQNFASELRKSSESLKFGENNVTLKTYPYRDFIPATVKNKDLLRCAIILYDTDSIALSDQIHLVKNYVVNGNEIWTAKYKEVTNSQDFKITTGVNGGPTWEVGSVVDVISEIEYKGQIFRLLSKNQVIEATM